MPDLNPLDMSDEDFLNLPYPEDEEESGETDVEEDTDAEVSDEEEDQESEDEADIEEGEEDEVDDEESESDELDDEEESQPESKALDDSDSDSTTNEEESDSEESSKDDSTDDIPEDLKAIYAPFKASGKEITVDNVDDVRRLMKMGADYHKKMNVIAPQLKIVKMLEKHDLLDVDKLSFLIDLEKKNPQAIKKLVDNSGVDLDELEDSPDKEYSPSNYAVGDKEFELDQVLTDIQQTSTYDRTMNIVTKQWDAASKTKLGDQPGILRHINDQVADGTYDKIMAIVDRDNMLGRSNGKSDLDAYIEVGNRLKEEFDLANQNSDPSRNEPELKKAESLKRKKQKRAVSSPKKLAKKKSADLSKINPLTMSDEEFAKLTVKFS